VLRRGEAVHCSAELKTLIFRSWQTRKLTCDYSRLFYFPEDGGRKFLPELP